MKPLISVIVPVWNVEKYLNKCIESIINQTYKHLEIILVDDGSTDNSGDICDEYAKMDSRIKVVHKENGGLVSARKAGIRASCGEYIGFVDSDDWIESGMYQHMLNCFIQYAVDLVSVGYYIDYKDRIIPEKMRRCGVYERDGLKDKNSYKNMFYLDESEIGYIAQSIWCKLFKREVAEKFYLDIPNENYMEDSACVYGCIPFLSSIYISNELYYHYNQTNESSICKNSKNEINNINDIMITYNYLYDLYQTHEAKEDLVNQLGKFTLKVLLGILPKDINNRILTYRFPVEELDRNSNIIIYGAGKVGFSYYHQFRKCNDINILSVVDKGKAGTELRNIIISNTDILSQKEFDYIIIALLREDLANEVIENLSTEHNIPKEKIIWKKPIHIVEEIMI